MDCKNDGKQDGVRRVRVKQSCRENSQVGAATQGTATDLRHPQIAQVTVVFSKYRLAIDTLVPVEYTAIRKKGQIYNS